MEEELIPEIDRDFLQEKEFVYQLIPFSGGVYLVIQNYPFPEAYTPREADLLVVLPAGYPNAPVDMFFTRPNVLLVNGNWPLNSAAQAIYNNQPWQQWSRHIQWRIGVDNLRTFFAAVKKELMKGI